MMQQLDLCAVIVENFLLWQSKSWRELILRSALSETSRAQLNEPLSFPGVYLIDQSTPVGKQEIVWEVLAKNPEIILFDASNFSKPYLKEQLRRCVRKHQSAVLVESDRSMRMWCQMFVPNLLEISVRRQTLNESEWEVLLSELVKLIHRFTFESKALKYLSHSLAQSRCDLYHAVCFSQLFAQGRNKQIVDLVSVQLAVEYAPEYLTIQEMLPIAIGIQIESLSEKLGLNATLDLFEAAVVRSSVNSNQRYNLHSANKLQIPPSTLSSKLKALRTEMKTIDNFFESFKPKISTDFST